MAWITVARQEKNYLGRVSDKKFGGSSLFPPPHLLLYRNALPLCPFFGGICHYSMPTVVELGGAESTWIKGQLHILILEVSLIKCLVAQAFFPPPPPFSTALCPFFGWICYYSMPIVAELG